MPNKPAPAPDVDLMRYYARFTYLPSAELIGLLGFTEDFAATYFKKDESSGLLYRFSAFAESGTFVVGVHSSGRSPVFPAARVVASDEQLLQLLREADVPLPAAFAA